MGGRQVEDRQVEDRQVDSAVMSVNSPVTLCRSFRVTCLQQTT